MSAELNTGTGLLTVQFNQPMQAGPTAAEQWTAVVNGAFGSHWGGSLGAFGAVVGSVATVPLIFSFDGPGVTNAAYAGPPRDVYSADGVRMANQAVIPLTAV